MLRHTFCHLPGIGSRTEQSLWLAGVHSWEDLLSQSATRPSRRHWAGHVEESLAQFQAGNPGYFSRQLPSKEGWRLFKDFRAGCAYLDIETTGLGNPGDHVTTITLYDGAFVRCYVHGVNLDDFPRDVQNYRVLVTYNGTTFDIPFLERQFRISLPHAHIDLRYVLRGLGLTGGLKRCEQRMGLTRPGLQDVDGYAAVLLWHEYRRTNNPKALETLLAYNVQDTVNLELLLVEAFNRQVAATPFAAAHRLPAAAPVTNPYTPDPALVAKVVGTDGWAVPFGR